MSQTMEFDKIPKSNLLPEFGPRAVSLACSIHHDHQPEYPYSELHHVIPQAWQETWSPPGNTKRLWDPRTVPICPSGHRYVHVLIVETMRLMQAEKAFDYDSQGGISAWVRAIVAARRAKGVTVPRQEPLTAALAMQRFVAAGGSIADLWAAGQYGEA